MVGFSNVQELVQFFNSYFLRKSHVSEIERSAVIQRQFCDRNTIFGAGPTIMFIRQNMFTPESWKYQNGTEFPIFMVLHTDMSEQNKIFQSYQPMLNHYDFDCF